MFKASMIAYVIYEENSNWITVVRFGNWSKTFLTLAQREKNVEELLHIDHKEFHINKGTHSRIPQLKFDSCSVFHFNDSSEKIHTDSGVR